MRVSELTTLVLVCVDVVHRVNAQDAATRLNQMFEEYGGDSWIRSDGWGDGEPCGDADNEPWYGVTCNDAGVITTLDLSDNNLVGPLTFWGNNPVGTYFTMDGLDNLILDNNHLTGPLPSMVSSYPMREKVSIAGNELVSPLSNMDIWLSTGFLKELDLSNNLFDDPSWGLNLEFNYNLAEVLNLSNNKFTGALPEASPFFPGNLKRLDLSGNDWEGGIPLSWEVWNFTTADELVLTGVQLSCPYPEWIDAEALNLDECICDVRCESGGGTCGPDNVCECNTNFGCWSGPYCRESTSCPDAGFGKGTCNQISGRGECAEDGCGCACSAAAGDDCTVLKCPGFDVDDDADFGCDAGFDHGECDTAFGTCTCTDLWKGDGCELSKCPQSGVRRIPDPEGEDGDEMDVHCSGQGKCFSETGHCFCDNGFLTNDCSLPDVVAEAEPKSKTVPIVVGVGIAVFVVAVSYLVYRQRMKDNERYGSVIVDGFSDDLLPSDQRNGRELGGSGSGGDDYGAMRHSRSRSSSSGSSDPPRGR